jgi:rubredoxin
MRPDFSAACPACGSEGIRPVAQQNRFSPSEPGGDPAPGALHVATRREYACDACGHSWAETVPHPRGGNGSPSPTSSP